MRGTTPRRGRNNFSRGKIAVIRLVCQGKSRNGIASSLVMSESNAKGFIAGILKKTGFDSIMKFSVYAVAHGFILPGR